MRAVLRGRRSRLRIGANAGIASGGVLGGQVVTGLGIQYAALAAAAACLLSLPATIVNGSLWPATSTGSTGEVGHGDDGGVERGVHDDGGPYRGGAFPDPPQDRPDHGDRDDRDGGSTVMAPSVTRAPWPTANTTVTITPPQPMGAPNTRQGRPNTWFSSASSAPRHSSSSVGPGRVSWNSRCSRVGRVSPTPAAQLSRA